MKKSLKQVHPEDFDAEALMAAAREGRLYVDEGINQVSSEQIIEDVRANVARVPEGLIGPDDIHMLIETVNKLSNSYEQLAQQLTNNVGEEPDNSQTKPVDNRVPSFDEMMQVFKKAKSEGLWNCKRSWGVGYQMWKIWGWKGIEGAEVPDPSAPKNDASTYHNWGRIFCNYHRLSCPPM